MHLFSSKLFYYALINNLLPTINGNYHIKKAFLIQSIFITSFKTAFSNVCSNRLNYFQYKPMNILLFGHEAIMKHQICKFLKLLIENSLILNFSNIIYFKKKEECL